MSIAKPKLCIVTPCHWTGAFGGAEQQILLFVNELVRREICDLTYVASDVDKTYTANSYKLERIIRKPSLLRAGYIPDGSQLLKILGYVRPDIIYQRVGCAYTGVAAYYAKVNGCKMVWHISSDMNVLPLRYDRYKSGNIIARYLDKKILEYGIRHSTNIIAQTRYQGEMLRKYYDRRPTKIIPNYQPIPDLKEKPIQPIRIAWISNLKPMKRPELFIRLANAFESCSDVQFIMLGQAYNTNWCTQIVEDIKSHGNIQYLGKQTQDEVNEILSQSHLLVNTSAYEGFPNTFIQAWMRGVPVISMDVNPDNILVEKGAGLVSKSFEGLCRDVELLVYDKELRINMAHNARSHAINNHSSRNLEAVIQEVFG